MKKGKKSQYLFYYLLFYIYFIITVPFLILASFLIRLFPFTKWFDSLCELHLNKLDIWHEFIDLYKTTGHKYRQEEYRYEIYTDKRDKALQKKEKYIVTDFAFFYDRTIIYYEPYNCPALKKYIHKNIKSINASLKVKRQVLYFWPLLHTNSKQTSLQYIIYNTPNKELEKRDVLFEFFKEPKWTSQLLNEWLELVKIDGPCFIQYIERVNTKSNKAIYSIFHLPYQKKHEIRDALKYYSYQLRDNNSSIFFQKTF